MKRLVDFVLGAAVAAVLLGPVAWADVRHGMVLPVPAAAIQQQAPDGAAHVTAAPDVGQLVRLLRHFL